MLKLIRRCVAFVRGARSNRMHALAIVAVFTVVMAASLFAAKDPVGLFRSSDDAEANGKGKGVQSVKAVGVLGASTLAGDDPVLHFTETKVGQVVFSAQSDTCRRVLFDNKTGARYEMGEMFCGQTVEQVTDAETPTRFQSLSKSFKK